jgi:C-22 sterol desaturase
MSTKLVNMTNTLLELPHTWLTSSPKVDGGWSSWQYIATVLLGVILYDQVMYIKRKGSIAGPAFKIPLMGPFIQALHPKFDAYLAQWASGPLSCVSVFHK